MIHTVQHIEAVARLLRPLGETFVFLGGAVVPLLVDRPETLKIQPTKDVDVIVDVLSRRAYDDLQQRLRDQGPSARSVGKCTDLSLVGSHSRGPRDGRCDAHRGNHPWVFQFGYVEQCLVVHHQHAGLGGQLRAGGASAIRCLMGVFRMTVTCYERRGAGFVSALQRVADMARGRR